MTTARDSQPPSTYDPSTTTITEDPFAGITSEEKVTSLQLRNDALARLRRTAVPMRRSFVQKPPSETDRKSLLGAFVTGKKLLPLRLLLLIHALEPMLKDTAWNLEAWSRLLAGAETPRSHERVSQAFRHLQKEKLIDLTMTGQLFHAVPLLEDGSGKPFQRANALDAEVGHGYFTIPTAFWATGLADKLTLPGLSMLLVSLSETQQETSFQVPLDRMQEWYGVSERSSERGYKELADHGLLLTHVQRVNTVKSPTLVTYRTHRALKEPYSTQARAQAQAAMVARQQAGEAATT